VQAGFPSPADDFVEKSIDLNEELIANPAYHVVGRGWRSSASAVSKKISLPATGRGSAST